VQNLLAFSEPNDGVNGELGAVVRRHDYKDYKGNTWLGLKKSSEVFEVEVVRGRLQ
jgi:hypothetical protein